ncbi:MAG: glycoside hydrolase family 140 protein [Candidatus Omnitrophica bacterium]|nr:glycoside hydrolase family 140 protein [Candidatus Omnitrophota bacterium]
MKYKFWTKTLIVVCMGVFFVSSQDIRAEADQENNMPPYNFNAINAKKAKFEKKPVPKKLPKLEVSTDGHYLVAEGGEPFFWLGDTVWGLLKNATREEADYYLRHRAANGFNVVQAVALWGWGWRDGIGGDNAYGEVPFIKDDPARPNEKYWEHVDYIVNKAESYGMYMGLLPLWGGDQIARLHYFNEEQAYNYGIFLGQRYKDNRIIWILGGDTHGFKSPEVYRALAKSIAIGLTGEEDYDSHLMTFHPYGGYSSSAWFHDDQWLDFNMVQSGHSFNSDTYNRILFDYGRHLTKPVLDGEPSYENIYHDLNKRNPKINSHEVRKAAYWAVLAGACGHTYGAHELFVFYKGGDPGNWNADTYWYDALDFPGSDDMKHLRDLFKEFPFNKLVKDAALLITDKGYGDHHIESAMATDKSFGLIYVPNGKKIEVNTLVLKGKNVQAFWFNPRDGKRALIKTFSEKGAQEFLPPSQSQDWLLILESMGTETEKQDENEEEIL